MPFQLDATLAVLVLAVLLIVALLIAWRLNVNHTLADRPEYKPPGMQEVAEAKIEPGEREATLIGEQVEEMVRAELAEAAPSEELDLDFGTEVDGSLAVWFGGRKYSDPGEIPDPRVRTAVVKAVERFNHEHGGQV